MQKLHEGFTCSFDGENFYAIGIVGLLKKFLALSNNLCLHMRLIADRKLLA